MIDIYGAENLPTPESIADLSIADIYYNKLIDSFENRMLKNEEIRGGRSISSYSVKMGERRNTFHKYL